MNDDFNNLFALQSKEYLTLNTPLLSPSLSLPLCRQDLYCQVYSILVTRRSRANGQGRGGGPLD